MSWTLNAETTCPGRNPDFTSAASETAAATINNAADETNMRFIRRSSIVPETGPGNPLAAAGRDHTQIRELTELAAAYSDTTIILDHFGGPVGIGPYEGKLEENFAQWRADITELAKCQNVVAKLGGINMELNGLDGTNRAARPLRTN